MDKFDLEMVDGLKESGDSTALKIEVIEETALAGSVPIGTFGNGCEKQRAFSKLGEMVDHKNDENQEKGGTREKRHRRRGNSHKKSEAQDSCKGGRDETRNSEREYVVTDAQNRGKKCGEEAKITYSIEEMEAMRFLDLEAQKKRWVEVYCGLAPAVVKEYDGLVNCNQQKHIQLDFEPQKQFQNVQLNRGVHGEDFFEGVDHVTENVNYSDPNSECSEEDGGDDEYNSILRPAFFVSGEPKFDSGPPQDGLEYLRRVRWEAEQIPKVKVVKLEKNKVSKEQTVYMPKIPDIAKCPEHLLPMKEWEDMFLADFVELRLSSWESSFQLAFSGVDQSSARSSSILKLSCPFDEQESNTQLPGNLAENINNIISNEVESSCDPNPSLIVNGNTDCKTSFTSSSKESPTLSVILKMDSVARLSMLRRRITLLENVTSLSKNDCAWLFALCIAIDTPLDGDTLASLRCLLRKAASLRAESTHMDDQVIMLNIIATITGKYFGQSG